MDKSAGKLPRKRPGRESSYRCDSCKISLYCFMLQAIPYNKKLHSKIHRFEETIMFQYFIILLILFCCSDIVYMLNL